MVRQKSFKRATVKRIQDKTYGAGYKTGFAQGSAYERTKGTAKWKSHPRYIKVRVKKK